MDFKSLQYFVTVAEELNFTKAAEKLHMSQPPLSRQIQELEEDLEVQLFIRRPRKLKLTEEGSLFYQRAIQMLEFTEETRSELTSLHHALSGKLHIGLVGGRTPFFAARWINGFHKKYPAVRFKLSNGGTDEMLDQMRSGRISMAVIAMPYDQENIEGFSIGREPWTAVLPIDHPLTLAEPGIDSVTLQQLADHPLIIPTRKYRKSAIRQWFRSIGEVPKILCEMSDYLDAVALVEQGAGIAIYPQTTYTPNALVETRIIINPARYAEYAFVWNRGAKLSALEQQFIRFVKAYGESEDPYGHHSLLDYKEFHIPPDAEPL